MAATKARKKMEFFISSVILNLMDAIDDTKMGALTRGALFQFLPCFISNRNGKKRAIQSTHALFGAKWPFNSTKPLKPISFLEGNNKTAPFLA